MTTLKVCNYIVALLTLIIGGSIAWTSYGYGIEMTVFGPGPGFWPFILAVGLIVVAFLIVFDTVKHQNDYGKEQIVLAAAENFSVYKMMVLTGGYLVLIYLTGFYVAADSVTGVFSGYLRSVRHAAAYHHASINLYGVGIWMRY